MILSGLVTLILSSGWLNVPSSQVSDDSHRKEIDELKHVEKAEADEESNSASDCSCNQ